MSRLRSGGNIGCVSSASWGQLDGCLRVGKAGVCVARGGKAVLFLEEEPEDGLMVGAGWRAEGMRWRWAVVVGSSCLLKAAEMPQNRCVESDGQAKSRGTCWLWEGSSSGECIGGTKATRSCRPGDKPCLGSEKLAQTETGTATM